ncbi:MAG: hypothetical protein GY696_26460 [Gammaproteobacteria bacterium]|nr:hypothetical protein [Gammaproteobacteria bacterium]
MLHLGNVTKDNATIVERSPLAGFLSTADRFKHQNVHDKTRSGKTVLLRHQITQDIHSGYGVVLITPERGLIDDVLSYIPNERADDVVFLNPTDAQAPIVGFNPFDTPPAHELTQKAGDAYSGEREHQFWSIVNT